MSGRASQFRELLGERDVVFDGAMGTSLHALSLTLDDYQGLENCSEILNVTRPDVIERVHRGFLEAGCDVIETNTCGANRPVLAEFGLVDRVYELNAAAARIAPRYARPSGLSTGAQASWRSGKSMPYRAGALRKVRRASSQTW